MPATGQPAVPADTVETPTVAPPPPTSPRPRSSAWVGYLVLLVVLPLLVFGGWYLLRQLRSGQEGLDSQANRKDQQLLEVTRQLSSLQAELASLHSQVAALQSQIATQDAKVERALGDQRDQLNERLNLARTEFSGQVQHIQRQLNKSRGDLMVADAEYLLSIANQKLHLVGDVKSVLAAMEAADQRLHDSGDPAVFKVREALAEEIDRLKKLDAPDVVGMSAKLLALENKAKTLPLRLPAAASAKQRAQESEAERSEQERQEEGKSALDAALEDIKELVTVRHTDRPVAEILTPEQAEALRQVLLLKLEAARAALLRSDEALYRASLTSALDWLKEHFDPEAPQSRDLASELEALLAHDISIPFPDISQSLSLLRNIERLRLEAEEKGAHGEAQRPAPPSAPAPGSAGPASGAQP
ncbi:uroporphyrinogen-III C-methyltransferase [Candidatus Methylocalor cossyra]|uniref:Homolog of E. coli HemX protein n=1 Tax=Candidatus Methylocalor cossyra TaxID=3108543 RepID=A0ABM9NLM4_9GAMM